MVNLKKAFLNPYMIAFCIGFLIVIVTYQLFQTDERTAQTEPDKIRTTESVTTDKVKPRVSTESKITEQTPQNSPRSKVKPRVSTESKITEQTPQNSPKTDAFENNDEPHSDLPILELPQEVADNKAHALDANLEDLPKILEKELFKDVPPELLSDIKIIASDEDMKALLEKLQADPNPSKEKQIYIDIVKQSIEDKNRFENQ